MKARKKKIIKYLETYNQEAIEHFKKDKHMFIEENKPEYKDNRDEYMNKKAKEQEDKFLGHIANG